jgi:hypothetical protein
MLKATVNGLQRLRRPEDVAQIRGLTVSQVLPVPTREVEEEQVEPAGPQEPAPTEEAPLAEETDGEGTDNPDT